MDEKVKENRIRRKAQRLGFRVEKSRVRDPMAPDFGKYWILSEFTRNLLDGFDNSGRHCLSLQDLEDRFSDEAYVNGLRARP